MGPGGCPSPWRSPRVVLTLFLVFLSGASAGALGLRYLRPAPPAALSWKEGGKEVTLQMFRKELKLTEEQSAEVETVLDDFVMYYQTLQAQMDEVRASGKDRILRLLNEDQKEKFSRMLTDLQARQIQIR
ncbi:MAG: hypothetical protein JJE04_04350 [Acidobacteriia bacterium]|nr:hypothetical protein [Terriglobia bacterium]